MVPWDDPDKERAKEVPDIAPSSVRHGARPDCSAQGGLEPAKPLRSLSCCSSVLLRKGFQMASLILSCLSPAHSVPLRRSLLLTVPHRHWKFLLGAPKGPPCPSWTSPGARAAAGTTGAIWDPMAHPPWVTSRESLPSALKCTVPSELSVQLRACFLKKLERSPYSSSNDWKFGGEK